MARIERLPGDVRSQMALTLALAARDKVPFYAALHRDD